MAPVSSHPFNIGFVHEWFVSLAGSEKVLDEVLSLYPGSDLHCLLAKESVAQEMSSPFHLQTSYLQRWYQRLGKHEKLLPLMPLAVEQFDVSEYDVVFSNSHAVAKGVLCGPDQLHISYVHTPMRYAWDLQHQYLREAKLSRGLKSLITRYLLHKLRLWDVRTANNVDLFIANSQYIARRINKAYRRSAKVIYPPVDVDRFVCEDVKEDYYITAARLVPYKKVDIIVEAFARLLPSKKLIVVGDGPQMTEIKRLAAGNVELMGHCSNQTLVDLLQRARAFVYAAEEDFGILPVEAQACGTPVIAFGKGGAMETVCDAGQPTGVFFDEQAPGSVAEAIKKFEAHRGGFDPKVCRANAERFSAERFRNEIRAFIEQAYMTFKEGAQSAREH